MFCVQCASVIHNATQLAIYLHRTLLVHLETLSYAIYPFTHYATFFTLMKPDLNYLCWPALISQLAIFTVGQGFLTQALIGVWSSYTLQGNLLF